MITVRYFAGAQAAAGTDEETLPEGADRTVQEVAELLATRHGAELARVLAASTFLVNEVAGPRDRVVPTGATLDVLPPFAGG